MTDFATAAIESAAETPATPQPERPRVLDNTLCLAITINRLGVRRKASMAAVTVQADKALLGLSKKLLESEKIAKINLVVSHTRQYLKETALPSFFKSGVYLVPDAMVPTVEAKLIGFRAEFDAAVADFLAEYPTLIETMAAPLGVLYNPLDYPSVGKVAEAFGMEWRYVSFDVPGRLRMISAAMFEQAREKAAADIAVATDEIKTALRVAMADMVAGMVEKLKPTDDGKRRRLSASSVEKLNGFLGSFDMRNVANDTELSALVARARAVMAGADVEALRGDDDLRANVQQAFEALQADIQPLTLGRHARAIDADDE